MKKYLSSALVLLLAANVAMAGLMNNGRESPIARHNAYEDEGPWQEASVTLPVFSDKFDWREIAMPDEVKQRVFIDAASIQIAPDQTTRFTLRQLSSKGAENISREGILCKERSLRSYAFADMTDKRWIESTRASWQKAGFNDFYRHTLINNLCPEGMAARDVEALLGNLNKPDAHIRNK